jgi:hypothetical protein
MMNANSSSWRPFLLLVVLLLVGVSSVFYLTFLAGTPPNLFLAPPPISELNPLTDQLRRALVKRGPPHDRHRPTA